MGRPVSARPLVLDVGALIAFDRRDRRVAVLVQRALELNSPILVPAGALAQAWRDGSRQANLARLLHDRGVSVEYLTEAWAKAAGELCGRRDTADVIDAFVVLVTRRHGGVVASSDPDDLHHLDPHLDVAEI